MIHRINGQPGELHRGKLAKTSCSRYLDNSELLWRILNLSYHLVTKWGCFHFSLENEWTHPSPVKGSMGNLNPPNTYTVGVLVKVSITVKRQDDHGNFYKEKYLIGVAHLQFRGSVYCYHGRTWCWRRSWESGIFFVCLFWFLRWLLCVGFGTHSVDQVGLKLTEIRLPLPLECWD